MPDAYYPPLTENREGWRSVSTPDLQKLAPQAGESLSGGHPAVRAAGRRVDAWWHALQAALGDQRRLRCERVWMHPRALESLEEWVSRPLLRAPAPIREAWESEWIWSAPSASPEVPEGVVLVEDRAWEPPHRA